MRPRTLVMQAPKRVISLLGMHAFPPTPDATVSPDWLHPAPVPDNSDVLHIITCRRACQRAHAFGTWSLQAPALHPSIPDTSLTLYPFQHRLLFTHLTTITRRS